MFDVFIGLYNPSPHLDPRRPLDILYTFKAAFYCPNDI